MATENTPETDAPQVPGAVKQPRPLWRRMLKWLFVTVGVLLLLVILAVLFFHTGPGKNIVRGVVEDGLAKRYDGTVTLGGLDYALFGDVAIDELKVVDRQGKTALHLHHLGLALDWGELLGGALVIDELAVDGVDVDTVALKAVQKEPTKLPGTVTIKELDVQHVNATIARPDGSVTRVTDLAIHGAVAMDERAQTLDAAIDRLAMNVEMTRPDGTRVSLPLATGLDATRRGAEFTLKTRAIASTVHVELPGRPAVDLPLTVGALDVKADPGQAQLDFAGLGAGPLTLERLQGEVRFDADGKPAGPQRLALEGMVISAAGLEALLGREVLLSDVRADIGVEGPPEALAVSGDVRTDGGTLSLRGTVDASSPPELAYDLRLTGDGIDTTKLLPDPQSPLRTSLTLTVKGEGIQPGALDADVRFTLGPTELNGRPLDSLELEASARGPVYAVQKLSVSALGQTIEVVGSLDRDTRRFSAHIKSVAGLADAVAKARDAGLLLIPLPPFSGSLDIDLTAEGTLLPEGVPLVERAAAEGAIVQLEQLPIERMTLKGHIDGDELHVDDPLRGDLRLGRLGLLADLTIADQKPTGALTLTLGALDAGETTLDDARVEITLDGLRQHIAISATDERQKLDLKAVLDSVVDLEAGSGEATLQELAVTRGAFETKLLAPVTVHIAPPDPSGDRAYTLPRTELTLAGGSLSLGGTARLRRDPDHPEATLLSHLSGSLEFDRLSIGRLAALARKSTRGVGGTLSGSVGFDGTPEDPSATFGLTIRAGTRGGDAAQVKIQGAVQDARLRTEVRVTDAGSRALLAEMSVKAPLSLGPGKKPGLAPGGALTFTLDVPKRRLGAFAGYMPNGLPPNVDPEATLEAHAGFTGTPAHPAGEFALTVEGALAPRERLKDPTARQKLTLGGTLRQMGGGKTAFDGHLMAWLDAAAAPLLDVAAEASFGRSPLLRSGLTRPWTFSVNLAPIALAQLPLDAPASGSLSGALALSGDGGDLFAHGGLSVSQLVVGTAPQADVAAEFSIDTKETSFGLEVGAAGMDVFSAKGTLGLAGVGLRTGMKARLRRLAEAPIALTLSLPKRSLARWGTLAPKPITLPGDFGGALTVSGTVGAPVAKGELGWDGFTTLAGTPGRVALVVDADGARASGGLEIGPRDASGVAPVVFALSAAPAKILKKEPFDVAITGRAVAVDLLSLLPASIAEGGKIALAGLFDCDIDGLLHLVPEGGDLRLDAGASRLGGALTVRDVRAPLPGSERSIHDGLFQISLAPDTLGMTLRAREKDMQKGDRRIDVVANVALDALTPTTAVLDVTTQDWLILGLGLDTPEGELDLAMKVTATKLLEPVKDIDVLVSHVDLYAPERFVRAHFQQFTSYGDVVYLDESGMPSGKLKPPPLAKPRAAAPPDAAPPGGFDVHLRIPEPIHVIKDPLTVDVQGAMEVAMRGAALTVNGRLDVVDGAINVMGWSWPLDHGAITVDGPLETFLAALTFKKAVHPTALRDIAVDEDPRLRNTYITVTIDLVNGQQIHFDGAAGPYLLDVATVLNTGRAVRWSRADLPASVNVQFGQPEQGLVNTFVQTNLRQLIFMDRANGWSDPIDDAGQYGRIWNFIAERYLADGGQRLRFVTRPPEIGRNHLELQYDLLFDDGPRSVIGAGARLGDELRLGVGLFWEFWSRD
ncbi:MAG: hypothetical protein CVU56_19275 [Deltaproteobacteria bacterium HGW-Deltaproteobacteria-14]|jgi:hypothetical protein|nr:MAG: hypothetical protein CVU56_19275 [Deltaproteobacteria bacterium HGW-Deltaproteobacteria-14]